jgi:hypothetical protein
MADTLTNICQNISQNISQNINQNISQNINQNISQTIGQHISQNFGHSLSQNFCQNICSMADAVSNICPTSHALLVSRAMSPHSKHVYIGGGIPCPNSQMTY